ncbi:MAG: HAD family hydrolase [Mycoplasma sp.]|nr:HAD family hydrolase [Mycoplasma sp.]
MKNRYIFATDVDGTMLMDNGHVHPETLNAFKKAQENGSVVVIATGRSVVRTKPLVEKMPYVDYFVCNNGAVVYDVNNNEVIYLDGVDPKHYPTLLDFARKHNLTFKLHTENDWIGDIGVEEQIPTILTDEMDQEIRKYIKENPNSTKLYNGQTPTQLSVNGSEEFCKKHYEDLKKIFEHNSSVYLTNSTYIDVNPKDKSKWTGLLEIAKKLNIDKNNIVTFGDSGNDLEMLQGSGEHGYPLANSKKELTDIIPAKIGSNNTNAIGLKVIEYLEK